jgi:hypothetical protein
VPQFFSDGSIKHGDRGKVQAIPYDRCINNAVVRANSTTSAYSCASRRICIIGVWAALRTLLNPQTIGHFS